MTTSGAFNSDESRAQQLRRSPASLRSSPETTASASGALGTPRNPASGNPVFAHIDGYTHKGKRLSYASSCIYFDGEAGTGYNKDMKMWQCLDDF